MMDELMPTGFFYLFIYLLTQYFSGAASTDGCFGLNSGHTSLNFIFPKYIRMVVLGLFCFQPCDWLLSTQDSIKK